jgi:hypothetical protein
VAATTAKKTTRQPVAPTLPADLDADTLRAIIAEARTRLAKLGSLKARGRPRLLERDVALFMADVLRSRRDGESPKARNSELGKALQNASKAKGRTRGASMTGRAKNILSPLRARANAQRDMIGSPDEAAKRIAEGRTLTLPPIFADLETPDREAFMRRVLDELNVLLAGHEK